MSARLQRACQRRTPGGDRAAIRRDLRKSRAARVRIAQPHAARFPG
jgi:hypothetical protein